MLRYTAIVHQQHTHPQSLNTVPQAMLNFRDVVPVYIATKNQITKAFLWQ